MFVFFGKRLVSVLFCFFLLCTVASAFGDNMPQTSFSGIEALNNDAQAVFSPTAKISPMAFRCPYLPSYASTTAEISSMAVTETPTTAVPPTSATASSTNAVAAFEAPRVFKLENGLSVLIKEDARFPLISVRLFVKAGAAWEKSEEAGMSHLLEHMVFKGSKTSGAGVDKLVENAGGSMNAYTSYDMTVYLTDLPSAQWKVALRAVRDLAFDPLLDAKELEAEKKVVLAEKKQREDNPGTKIFQATMAACLMGTPYATPVIGNADAIKSMTSESIRQYIRRRYDPRDMVLSVAGNVKAEQILAESRLLFGGYENHNILETAKSFEPESLAGGLRIGMKKGPWKKALATLSFPIPKSSDGLLPVADVLAHMLGGDETGLLPKTLHVQKDLADDISASALSFERAGLFLISMETDPEKLLPLLKEVAKSMASLRAENFSETEIARARLNLEDSYFRSLEKLSGISQTMGEEYFYDPGALGGGRYLSTVRSAGPRQVAEVLSRWIRPEALSVQVLLPDGIGVTETDIRTIFEKAWPTTGKREKDGKSERSDSEVLNLEGGGKLVLLPDSSLPYLSATLDFSGGEMLVGDEQQGLASLAASVLTSGTENKDYARMTAFLADRAAALSAGTGLRHFSLRMDAPERFSDDVLELLREVLQKPAFRDEDLLRCKREQIAAIVSREESAVGLAGRRLRPFLYETGTFAHQTDGTLRTVNALTRRDIVEFWRNQAAQPWVLSVAGRFDREKILAFAKSLPRPSVEKSTMELPKWTEKKNEVNHLKGREQAVLLLAFPTDGTDSPDRPALRLLCEALDGFTGKLYQELREKRSLGYSVFPMEWVEKGTGLLAFGIIASPENLDEARSSFARIVEDLKKELLPTETLARAKAVAEGDYWRARQSRGMRSAEGATQILEGRPLDHGIRLLEKMKVLEAKDLQEMARKYLDMNKARELVVQP